MIDQLAESYHSTSPYAYVLNNPVMLTDPDGRKVAPIDQFDGNVPSGGLMAYYSGGGYSAYGSLDNYLGYQNPFKAMMSGGGGDGSGGGSTLSTSTQVGIGNLQRYFAENGITGISIDFIYNHYKNGELRWWSYTSDTIDENGNIWKGDIGQFNILKLKESSSVGQPGLGESLIPIWGSGRAAIDHFQNGNYWRGAAYTALAISDVFLVKSLAVGAGKLVVAGFGKLAAEEVAITASKQAGRVFWSGEGSKEIAEGYAKSNRLITLEMTRAGQNLQKLIEAKNIPWSEARPMWVRLSTVYAKGAEGTVHFFPGATVNSGSIWMTVEKNILLENGINIIAH